MRIVLLTALLLSSAFLSLKAGENDLNAFYRETMRSDQESRFFDVRGRIAQNPHGPQFTEKTLIFTFFGNNEHNDPATKGTFTALVTLPNQKVHVVTVPFDGSASISIPAPSQAGLYGIGVYADTEFSGVVNTQTVTVTSSDDIGALFHFNSLRIPHMQETTIYINKP